MTEKQITTYITKTCELSGKNLAYRARQRVPVLGAILDLVRIGISTGASSLLVTE
jgi:hypothetical protein